MSTTELAIFFTGATVGGYAVLLIGIGAGIHRDRRGIEASTRQLQAATARAED